jgi:hypothetical protein
MTQLVACGYCLLIDTDVRTGLQKVEFLVALEVFQVVIQ